MFRFVDSLDDKLCKVAALEKLGAWDGVKDKIAQAESVRAALLLVARGEAPLGIVYQTDAAADPSVKIVGTFPEKELVPALLRELDAIAKEDQQKLAS